MKKLIALVSVATLLGACDEPDRPQLSAFLGDQTYLVPVAGPDSNHLIIASQPAANLDLTLEEQRHQLQTEMTTKIIAIRTQYAIELEQLERRYGDAAENHAP